MYVIIRSSPQIEQVPRAREFGKRDWRGQSEDEFLSSNINPDGDKYLVLSHSEGRTSIAHIMVRGRMVMLLSQPFLSVAAVLSLSNTTDST